MERFSYRLVSLLIIAMSFGFAHAQFNLKKVLSAGTKVAQALTLTDAQMAEYVKASVAEMDKNNPIPEEGNPHAERLAKLTEGITDADGIPLNFKVYEVADVNAFACPDGSVRVFAGLMEIMDDDELMGVVGHEIGHVMKHHSKNQFRNELLTGAAKDAIASASGKLAALTETQLGALGQSFMKARYSQSQENEADNCGYDFLVSKGRNPWGMVKAFEKLKGMEGEGTQSYMARMFSSHPDTQARINAMKARCENDGYKRP